MMQQNRRQQNKALAVGLILLAEQMSMSMKSIHLFHKVQPLHMLHKSIQAQIWERHTR